MEKPSLPKGTRDFGPSIMSKRQFIFDTIRTIFQKFGFLPLETPAMENLTTLTGKYGDEGDQLLFKVLNSGDYLKGVDSAKLETRNSKQVTQDISEKGLRYDLTVPFARYVVMNRHEITFPFKRYQMQPVWRADRPQKGRYREFYQCDVDVVGTHSLICEAEIIMIILEAMQNLGVNDFTVKINHRGVLNGIAEAIGVSGKESDLFVAIDKLEKIGEEKVREELSGKDFSKDQLDKLFSILSINANNDKKLSSLSEMIAKASSGQKGLSDLNEVFQYLKHYEVSDSQVEFDISLARGLSYYTGCIFEVKINNVAIGSVSGGGRYDNLTGTFGDKDNLSGVGISFGVDRIYDAMEELKLFPADTQASSSVLVCHFDEESRNYGMMVLAKLRKAEIASEIYPDISKMKKQLDYANKKMIGHAVVIGADEINSGELTLKNMKSGEQEKLPLKTIIQKLKS
ncbi:MAG: histidine--tRNA ligase [Cyclobacteriaceae bacterium]|nr:histidine--tRNA ligase [Cyclobacteriaceae bacterium]